MIYWVYRYKTGHILKGWGGKPERFLKFFFYYLKYRYKKKRNEAEKSIRSIRPSTQLLGGGGVKRGVTISIIKRGIPIIRILHECPIGAGPTSGRTGVWPSLLKSMGVGSWWDRAYLWHLLKMGVL